MKKNCLKCIAIAGISLMSLSVSAQMGDAAQVLNGGLDDANKLIKAYMQPYGEGFALGLANGWYNTAKPHKLFGFDLTFTAGMTSIPSSKLTFDANSLGLKTLQVNPNLSIGPTIAGKKEDGAELTLSRTGTIGGVSRTVETKFRMPQGIDFAYTPTVMVQAAVGLPFGSEFMFRLLPSTKIGDYGKIGLWGFGFKHDIKQWIPIISATPFWDMSVMMGYTKFKSTTTGVFLEPTEDLYYAQEIASNKVVYDNQSVELTSKAFTMNLLVSTNIPVFNVYGGLGFTTAGSELALKGNYPTPKIPTGYYGTPIKAGIQNVNNPVNVKFDDLGTVVKATIGARLKLLLMTLHGDVTFSGGYTMYSAGFGISFR